MDKADWSDSGPVTAAPRSDPRIFKTEVKHKLNNPLEGNLYAPLRWPLAGEDGEELPTHALQRKPSSPVLTAHMQADAQRELFKAAVHQYAGFNVRVHASAEAGGPEYQTALTNRRRCWQHVLDLYDDKPVPKEARLLGDTLPQPVRVHAAPWETQVRLDFDCVDDARKFYKLLAEYKKT